MPDIPLRRTQRLKIHRLPVSMDDDDRANLDTLMAHHHCSGSEIIRRLIRAEAERLAND